MPYEEVEHAEVYLPERERGEGYGRRHLPAEMFVPEYY